jgi:Domain of unknown function (DUF222)
MELGEVVELVSCVHAFDTASASLDDCRAVLAEVVRLSGWVESRRLAIVERVGEVSSFPEKHISEAGRTSQRAATAVAKRAATVRACPKLGKSLAAGRVTGEHVDAARRALAHVAPEKRDAFAETVGSLVPVAENGTPEQFEQALRRAIDAEDRVDGEDRLAKQKAAARLRTWVDKITGMYHFHGEYDPENGVGINAKLQRMVATLFADAVPEGCPTDPEGKQDWLRAQAFLALINGETVASGAPETVVVVDTRDGTITWDLDVDLPAGAVQRFVDRSNVYFVDVHGKVINFAEGRLNLGRTARLANKAQRRAKRALHATCTVHGCNVKYENTRLHHLVWWEHGGMTDLDNLVPVCSRHHGMIHAGKLRLHIDDVGNIITTETMATGPPEQQTA